MTFSIFLYIYWAILGIFVIFNFFVLRYIRTMRYLGKGVFYIVSAYCVGLILILLISHFYILKIDWNVALF